MSFEFFTEVPQGDEEVFTVPQGDEEVFTGPQADEEVSTAIVPYIPEPVMRDRSMLVRKKLLKINESASLNSKDWALIKSVVEDEVEGLNRNVVSMI